MGGERRRVPGLGRASTMNLRSIRLRGTVAAGDLVHGAYLHSMYRIHGTCKTEGQPAPVAHC
jgi:hypothetical protein